VRARGLDVPVCSVPRDLDVSEATYDELRHLPEANLSLREFVALQIFGQRQKLKADLEGARRDAQALAEAGQRAADDSEAQGRALARAAGAAAAAEEGARLELEGAKR
jgi:hypothetical protein